MKKTFGILAHVDAGKTTFSEQILFHANVVRNRGRVDHKDTFLDTHEIEKERGITVFSNQAVFSYQEESYYMIDTPGHIDFSTEMERAIEILDYAVVIVSAVEGVQGHTETVFRLLQKYHVPTFFFLNKIDLTSADTIKVCNELKQKLSINLIDLTYYKDRILSEEIIEQIAENDESLLETYLTTGYNEDQWILSLKNQIKECAIFPYMLGSALLDKGVKEFFDVFHELTETNYEKRGTLEEPFSARVSKIRYDEQGNRLTYMKALSGNLKVKDEISYQYKDKIKLEKVNQIRSYSGSKYHTLNLVTAGDVFAVTGLTKLKPGDGLGTLKDTVTYTIQPTMKAKVIYHESVDTRTMLGYFKILEAEDPMLKVTWNEALLEIHVNIMGNIQLEVLKQMIFSRFHEEIEFGNAEVLYKETITNTVMGYGHFEPLKHYAEVALRIEPTERNSDITYQSECHSDDLSMNYQNLIKTHIFEKEHIGVLIGAPLTDVKITLVTGIAHIKHTEGGDFREATYRAIRQALEKAESVLLEPYYTFRITVDTEYIGRLLSDITKLHGTFSPPDILENQMIVVGRGPVATFMNYSKELISFTRGKGSISLQFEGYDICHNKEDVIANKAYDKDRDVSVSSSSVFCKKGTSFVVKWDEVENYMHCLK